MRRATAARCWGLVAVVGGLLMPTPPIQAYAPTVRPRALLVLGRQPLRAAPHVSQVLGFPSLLAPFRLGRPFLADAPPAELAAERLTLRYVQWGGWGWHPFLVAERWNGAPFPAVPWTKPENGGDRVLYRVSPWQLWDTRADDLAALLQVLSIHERVPQPPASLWDLDDLVAVHGWRLHVDWMLPLLEFDAGDAAAILLYWAPPRGTGLAGAMADLDHIWHAGIAQGVGAYDKALSLVGTVYAARVDVGARGDRGLGARILLLLESDGAARRARMALGLGRQLARLAAGAAERSGSMTAAEAATLREVLDGLRLRAVGRVLEARFELDVDRLLH